MTTSTLPARYKINGLLDTKRPVMENLEKICNACGTFMTYDIHQGLWGVVINKTEATVAKAFTDANIIGPVQVQGTSILNLYNKVRVEFPLRDTADGTDFIEIEIPSGDRYPNEPDNVLQIRLEMCNEPVQAEIIGLIELKQSRIDQIVTFETDYSTLNLNAGDIISVTHDLYQFSAKQFRVITLKEVDGDDGSIRIEVTALAYDANVYDTSDLGRYIRSDRNGIRGIGSIGQPNEPTLTVYDQVARPGIEVEAVVPSGIVESMELWLSSDNSNFKLIATEYPTGGGTFNSGDTVVFDYDALDGQNIYVKVRGMNSTTTGPFSTVDSFLGYVPKQTTDAVGNSTDVTDSSGNSLLGTLSASALIALIKGLMEDNASGSGSLYNGFNTTYYSDTGKIITDAQVSYTYSTTINNTTTTSLLNAQMTNLGTYGEYNQTYTGNRNYWPYTYAVVPSGYDLLEIEVRTPLYNMSYDFYDPITSSVLTLSAYAQPAFEVNILRGSTLAGATIVAKSTIDWTSNYNKMLINNPTAGTYWVGLRLIPTLDLNSAWNKGSGPTNNIYFYNFVDQGSGSSVVQYTITATKY